MAKPKQEKDYSGRYPGARKIEGGGDWLTWEKPGQECVGVYKGTEPFRNGMKTTMVTEGGVVVFSTPKLLQGLLAGVSIGAHIAVVYVGEGEETDKGNAIKEFEVYVLPGSRE